MAESNLTHEFQHILLPLAGCSASSQTRANLIAQFLDVRIRIRVARRLTYSWVVIRVFLVEVWLNFENILRALGEFSPA